MNASSGIIQRGLRLLVGLLALLALAGVVSTATSNPASASTGTTGTVASVSASASAKALVMSAVPSSGVTWVTAVPVTHAEAAPLSPQFGHPSYVPVPNIPSVGKLWGGHWDNWFGESGNNNGNASIGFTYTAQAKGFLDTQFRFSVTPNVNHQGYIVFSLGVTGNGKWGVRRLSGQINVNQGDLSVGGVAVIYIGSSPVFTLTSYPNGMPVIEKGVNYGGCATALPTLSKSYSHLTVVGVTWKLNGSVLSAFARQGLRGSGTNRWVTSAQWSGPTSNDTLVATMRFARAWATVQLHANANTFATARGVAAHC